MASRVLPALLATSVGCAPEPGDPVAPTTPPGEPTQTTPAGTPSTGPIAGTYVPEGYVPTNLKHVVIIGDSITVGTLIDDDEDRWAKLLVEQCADCWPFEGGDLTDRYGPLDVLDLAQPGMTMIELILQHTDRIEATFGSPVEGGLLVIGTVGLADVIFGGARPAAEELYVNNLRLFNDYLADPEVFPDGAWFYLMNIYDPTDGMGFYPDCYQSQDMSLLFDATNSANQASRALAVEQGWAWVDAHTHFLGHGHNYADPAGPYFRSNDPGFWFVDCLHPNLEGHHEMRRIALAALDGDPIQD